MRSVSDHDVPSPASGDSWTTGSHVEVRRSEEQARLVEDELTELLRRRRKVANEKPDNFAIFGTDSLTRLVERT